MAKRSAKKTVKRSRTSERKNERTRKTISDFKNVKTEGVLLPVEILSRIAADDATLQGLRAEDYHLIPGERLNERITETWAEIKKCWEIFKRKRNALSEKGSDTTLTRNDWLLPLMQLLDYGKLEHCKESPEIDGKKYAISHEAKEPVAISLVGFRQELDKRDDYSTVSRTSPHSTVQEFLNQSSKHLWGFVSNGLKFRILRDNVSLVRAAYVEFNLEAIMESDSYGDFYLFFMLVHQSRLEIPKRESEIAPDNTEPTEDSETVKEESFVDARCWLEKWYDTARESGVRVRDLLRSGVEKAINALGSGFLAHRENADLRARLASGELSKQDYYNQILRVVYRILFLLVAEDRELLFSSKIPKATRELYTKYYSVSRIRKLAKRNRGTLHHDLWVQLNYNFQWFDSGQEKLGIPAFGSMLFRTDFVPELVSCKIKNRDLLAALHHLMFTKMNNVLQAINYRNLGTEELGSVYESLLEMHPEIDSGKGSGYSRFRLNVVAGSERKTTGSYYTPPSLVESLLDTALGPVVDAALENVKTTPEKINALLSLNVCDPACGSGHFLIGAAHRLGKRLAQLRSGEEEPSLTALQHAVRDVIGHCIYGVDINPMAVELCKVSLWIESMEPGKALMFLDHRIKCGNSLFGATPELLAEGIPDAAFTPIEGDEKDYCSRWKKENQREIRGQYQLPFNDTETAFESVQKIDKKAKAVDRLPNETAKDYDNKEKAYNSYRNSLEFQIESLKADLWCGAFVWRKVKTFDYPITQRLLLEAEKQHHFLTPWMQKELERLVEQYQFFHWHLEFPEVFSTGDDPLKQTGFDAVLGNPPWEQVQFDDREFFGNTRPDIVNAPNMSKRKKIIESLQKDDPGLYELYKDAMFFHHKLQGFIHDSGRFVYTNFGRLNTAPLFAETSISLLNAEGRCGVIVPSGIATDSFNQHFFNYLIDSKILVSLYDFENRKKLFPDVDSRMKFSLLTMCSPESPVQDGAKLAFFALDTKDLDKEDKRFCLSPDEIAMINPNTRTCPIFRGVKDAELTKAIYRRVPVLVRESKGGRDEVNPWQVKFQLMFMMNTDSHLFKTKDQLEQHEFHLVGNRFVKGDQCFLPLYEAKMATLFDHRAASIFISKTAVVRQGQADKFELNDYKNENKFPIPRYWVQKQAVDKCVKDNPNFLIGWRDITSPTNERTLMSTIIPYSAVGDTFLLMFPDNAEAKIQGVLVGCLNSFIVDYITRQKIGGIHLKFHTFRQIAILPKEIYSITSCFFKDSWKDWIFLRVYELSFTANDLRGFEEACGFSGEPFRWDEKRRFLLRCELDALFFGLYLGFGEWSTANEHEETPQQRAELTKYFPTPRDAVDYIMDTFPIVKRKDEANHNGSYRTKETILSIYDAMYEAVRNNTDYQTRLVPPPADDSMRHGGSISVQKTSSHQQPQSSIDMLQRIADIFSEFSEGRSSDYVIVHPDINTEFLKAVRASGIKAADVEINRSLMNARKRGLLKKVKTTHSHKLDQEANFYEFASEWALVVLKNEIQIETGLEVSLDTILCNPQYTERFDNYVFRFTTRFSSLDLRWLALRLRKRNKTIQNEATEPILPGLEEAVTFSANYSIQLAQDFYYVKKTLDFNKQRDIHLETSDGLIVPAWVSQPSNSRFTISIVDSEVYEQNLSTAVLNLHIAGS